VAGLHGAFKKIEDLVDTYDADFQNEFAKWILPELERAGLSFADGVMERVRGFLERDYHLLPRQLIHRDMHTGNLLFDNGALTGYLDFDLGQRNARVWDIVYLCCSLLAGNYREAERLGLWRGIYQGVLRGYEGLLPLNAAERLAIPALFLFDGILFTAFFSKTGQPETAKGCVEMADWLYENIDLL